MRDSNQQRMISKYIELLYQSGKIKMKSSFTTLIGSRGWHVYQKSTWRKPKKDESLSFQKETDRTALKFDPFSIAFTRKTTEYLTPITVGHVPLEISRFVYFFLERGGKMEAKVYRTKYEVSPIPKGGLEIVLQVTFTIEDEKKRYLARLVELIKENYESPKLEADEIAGNDNNGNGGEDIIEKNDDDLDT